jgi:hypothetical protein
MFAFKREKEPEDVTKVASLPFWMFCGYLCRSVRMEQKKIEPEDNNKGLLFTRCV